MANHKLECNNELYQMCTEHNMGLTPCASEYGVNCKLSPVSLVVGFFFIIIIRGLHGNK